MNWYVKCLQQYADFSGRARRTEYWMFVLFNMIVAFVVSLVGRMIGFAWLSSLYSLAVFIPSLAVSVRRLHDTGRSGWWILINLIPLVGFIWAIVLLCQDSKAETNEWGANPKA